MLTLVNAWENGEIELDEYVTDLGDKKWWLKIGICVAELDGVTMLQLLELMEAFLKEGTP